MILRNVLSLLLLFSIASSRLWAQDEYSDQLYVVLLGVNNPKDAALCYTERFDTKKVRMTYDFEDTVNYLSDFAYEEEEMYGPECFIPELKLVFRNYTYVVSLYCTRALKYKNSAPFRTSATRLPNDLVFTPSVYDYLYGLRSKLFGSLANSHAAEQMVTTDPLMNPDEDDGLEDLLFEEEDEFGEFDLDDEDEKLFQDEDEETEKYPYEEEEDPDDEDP